MLPRMPLPTGVISTIGQFQSPADDQQMPPASLSRSIVLNA